MKKAMFIILPIVLVAAIVVGMYFDNLKESRPEFLTDAEWSRYDGDLGENLNIAFTKDGRYSYYCDCGEHIGDSDNYDSFSYYKRFNRITLSGPEGKDFIMIRYYDKHTLCLLFDNGVHTFKNMKDPMGGEVIGDIKEYVDVENAPNLTVLGFKDGNLLVAPYNYDADAKDNFTEYITEIDTADDIKFTSITVRVENGKEDIEVYELSVSDYEYIGEYYTSGFLKFDIAGQISEVVFYGSTVIW